MLSTTHVLSIFFTFVAAILFIIIPSFYGEEIKNQHGEYVEYFFWMFISFVMILLSFVVILLFTLASLSV